MSVNRSIKMAWWFWAGRPFNVASFVSLALLGFTIVLSIAAFLDPQSGQQLSITHNVHVSVWRGWVMSNKVGNLAVYSGSPYDEGPMIFPLGLKMDNSDKIHKGWHCKGCGFDEIFYFNLRGMPWCKERLCFAPGIDFHHISFRNMAPTLPMPQWTLMVSLWYPLVLFSILPAMRFLVAGLASKKRTVKRGHLVSCF